MNFSSILFSGVAILVCMNSFVIMERVATCDINEHWTATMRAMKRCNSNIKNYYNEHEDQPLRYRYCKGMKVSCKARQSPALNYAEKNQGNRTSSPRFITKLIVTLKDTFPHI